MKEAFLVLGVFVFIVALWLGVDLLVAWGLQWVLSQVLDRHVPYIPVFIGVILLSIVTGGIRFSSSSS